jgi:DNA-directed RNA polymerase specialized sigma subunit
VEEHLRLAYSVASRFVQQSKKTRWVSPDQVKDSYEYADALMGLWRAIGKWSQEKGCFSTYAVKCMRNAIIDERNVRARQVRGEEVWSFDDLYTKDGVFNKLLVDEFFTTHPDDTPSDIRAKEALYDYYILGHSLQEIGLALNPAISKNRVMQLVRHAVSLLKARYQFTKDK